MEGNGKPVGFVTDQLHQVQNRRVMVERYRFVLLAVDIDNFFALGDRRQGLIDNLQRIKRFSSCVQLAQAAIDQHQAGHLLFLFLNTLVAARHHATDDELAVIRLLHLTIFPDHHRSHGLGSLDVRNVEALDASRQFGQAEGVLQRFLDGFGIRFHYAEALVVRLLGIVARQVEKSSLVAALGHKDVNSCGAGALARHLLAQNVFQRFTIFKLHGNVNVPWYVGLADVKLVEESRKEFVGMERTNGATGILARHVFWLSDRALLGWAGEGT